MVQKLNEGTVWIGQPGYTGQVLTRFGMRDSRPVSTASEPGEKLVKMGSKEEQSDQKRYQAAVGALLYLSTHTRPDISFAVGNMARFCAEPSEAHWTAIKRLFRYLRGTLELGIKYQKLGLQLVCVGYSDADWGGSLDDRKSTSGYLFGCGGGAVSWQSKKQTCVALSTAEAEYVALSAASQESVWLQRLISEISKTPVQRVEIR